MSSVLLYLSWELKSTLGPRGEEPVLGALQSPHLCCIKGRSQRPRTVDIPARPPDWQLSDTPNELGQISSLLRAQSLFLSVKTEV